MSFRFSPAAALISSFLAVAPVLAQRFTVTPADDWTAVFNPRTGWTGGDGVLSFPLNGVESSGASPRGPSLFLFGDSLIGSVRADGTRRPGTQIINNAVMFFTGDDPSAPNAARFWYRTDPDTGDPLAAFVPQTSDALPGDFYWLTDGIAVSGVTYIFATHLRPSGGAFPANQGPAMITLPAGSRPPFDNQTQTKPPLYIPAHDDLGPIQFPVCFMSNTAAARAPHPDGFLYIYGVREDPLVKKALVARIEPAHFSDFSAWRFWNGTDWVAGVANAAPITGRVSSLYSVTPLPDGRFLLVTQLDAIGADIAVRIGAAPAGPWGPPISIYTCPEAAENRNAILYNTTAHPEISKAGELIISYNVNSTDFLEALTYQKWSTPRFIRVNLQ